MSIKSIFYKIGLLKPIKLKTPVISIGNLTFGGTGKTPIAMFLVKLFLNKKLKICVVSKNYKTVRKINKQLPNSKSLQYPTKVDSMLENAAYVYGDEPTLIASKFPEVDVYVGPNKWETALLADKDESPDLIILDDGFQHHALKRNLDIVLIDATAEFSEYRWFPMGRLRESLKSLKRAQVIFLTKCNLVDENKLLQIHKMIKKYASSSVKIFKFDFILKLPLVTEAQKRVIGFSGIAKPSVFKSMLEMESRVQLMDFIGFSDHHKYSESDIKELLSRFQKHHADAFVTTEKDFVKIRNVIDPKYSILNAELIVQPAVVENSDEMFNEELYAILNRALH